MKLLVTAGPTREYIDTVRFISNASSGKMGCDIAAAAARAGHDVTLLLGPCQADPPQECRVERFVRVEDLRRLAGEHFPACDVLVMAAAVGDFRADRVLPTKLSRSAGPITIRLYPTEDVLAGLRPLRRDGQVVVAFAVEDVPEDRAIAKARDEMARKGADIVVLNTPAAMSAETSRACILSAAEVLLPWADRAKKDLAAEIIRLLAGKIAEDKSQ